MTKSVQKKLEPFERQMEMAMRCDFVRMDYAEMMEFFKVYKEHFGSELTKSQLNCSSCKLKAVQRLGRDYFAAKERKK